MAEPTGANADSSTPKFTPVVPPEASIPELTWSAVLAGAVLGIVFGASSLYLVLKVGITVSASIPVSVLSITLFRLLSRFTGMRRATILENNIVQTAGSAGESIAFGLGVTVPALMMLGFELELTRAMTVGVLGGLLGILMMIPLRRAFIVQQHGELTYPEGTAAAEVLKVGESGGTSAATVFAGFGIGFLYKLLSDPFKIIKDVATRKLYTPDGRGLKGGEMAGELSPELLGVGYIIGPRVASIMGAGGILAYLIFVPLIVMFGEKFPDAIPPGKKPISQMSVGALRQAYILYIGAGAVAAGGIISLLQALPLIVRSAAAGIRDIRRTAGASSSAASVRTDRDMSLKVVVYGCLGLVAALTLLPNVGLGISPEGIAGAVLVIAFGFLFVTVSARLTGQIGSSSNPISGMTVATLLITCLIFLALGKTGPTAMVTALTVAAVVCIASSNGGTTAQDLKTGYLVGATPKSQQVAIIVGSLTSALVMGGTLLVLNSAGEVVTASAKYLPPQEYRYPDAAALKEKKKPGAHLKEADDREYHILRAREGEVVLHAPGKPDFTLDQGEYLVDDGGVFRYLVDPAINGRVKVEKPVLDSVGKQKRDEDGEPMVEVQRFRDDGTEVTGFDAPKTRLMGFIIDGILNRKLPWGFVLLGVLLAIVLELSGVAALPFAVGVYLPISTSMPVFVGGALRWLVDLRGRQSDAEAESSPAVLLSSGYIAGGTIAGVVAAFLTFAGGFKDHLGNVGKSLLDRLGEMLSTDLGGAQWPTVMCFTVLCVILLRIGLQKRRSS